MASPRPILLTGAPGVGKTTVLRRFLDALPARFPVEGFITEELREEGQRVGFELCDVVGARARLAHIELPGPPRHGRYGLDLAPLEAMTRGLLARRRGCKLIIVDEVGPMECASEAFVRGIETLAEEGAPLVATVALRGEGFMARLRSWPRAEIFEVTPRNRDVLPFELLALLA